MALQHALLAKRLGAPLPEFHFSRGADQSSRLAPPGTLPRIADRRANCRGTARDMLAIGSRESNCARDRATVEDQPKTAPEPRALSAEEPDAVFRRARFHPCALP